MNENSGIYIITHIDSGRSYIGASSNLKRRKYHHYRSLHCGYAHSTEMLIDYQTSAVGNSAMDFRVLEYCEPVDLSVREKAHIDALNPVYNDNVGGGGIREVSDDFRAKQRRRWTGKQMRKVGRYFTPWGDFESTVVGADASDGLITQAALWKVCRKSDIAISRHSFSHSAYLQTRHDESVIGKTWASIGFGFSAE